MENIVLTKKDITNAESYLPLATKVGIVQAVAERCIAKVETAVKDGDNVEALPDRFQEDIFTKARICMGVFVYYYLKEDFGAKEDMAIPLNIYDQYGKSHIFNQLERFKADSELRDKIFDMLSDYKEWLKLLNTEIYAILSHRNDTAARMLVSLNKEVSPERMKEMVSVLEDVKQRAAEIEAQRHE